MSHPTDLYKVENYTDEQLFRILDLDNPTDRELEAKIHHMIWKYSHFQNESGEILTRFFENIYDRFFDQEEYDEHADDGIVVEGMGNMDQGSDTAAVSAPAPVSASGTVSDSSARQFSYSIPLEYSKDSLNPLLKQTTKRIVNIDSQFRENTNTVSTKFTFNLSTPLKDVVSLKLYSYSIPYTWYTISNSYGSNFFYIKGNSPGINDGNYIFQIQIGVGNYTVPQIIEAVNTKLQALQYDVSHSDISFGTTGITYNQNTALATLVFDIHKLYNETYYELYFSYWTSPNVTPNLRNTSIPSFLGFNYGFNKYSVYSPYTASMVRSVCDLPLTNGIGWVNDDYNISNIQVNVSGDLSNNWFKVIQYSDSGNVGYYDPATATIINTYQLTLSFTTSGLYSRYAVYTDVNLQLASNKNLHNSSLNRVDYNIPETIVGNGSSQYQLNIQLNRFTTKNVVGSKLVVQFPNDTYVWLGSTSAFHFRDVLNDLSTITSETNTIQSSYNITTQPTITFHCNNPYYNLNDISFNIPRSGNAGYLLNDYFNAIRQGFATANANTVDASNPEGIFNLVTTGPSLDSNSYFRLDIDITRKFKNPYYTMNIENSTLVSLIGMNVSGIVGVGATNLTGSIGPNEIVLTGDVFTLTSTFPYNGGGYQISVNQPILMTISPYRYSNYPNARAPPFVVPITTGFCSDLNTLANRINTAFSAYLDPNDVANNHPLTNCNISLVQSVDDPTIVNATLNISIIKSLIQKNYTMTLGDSGIVDVSNNWNTITNTWYNYCSLPVPVYNLSDLSYNNTDVIGFVSYSEVNGINPILDLNYIDINENNNIVYLSPKHSATGLYVSDINVQYANSILLTLPIQQYNRSQLISTLNYLLSTATTPNGQAIAMGSTFSTVNVGGLTYTTFRFNINKTFTGADFLLDFYDPFSFTSCFTVAKSIQNTTWDSTLGWILGFRKYTQYNLAIANIDSATGLVTLTGDTTVSVYIYNSFLIVLDDYNQNHMNDGLVTTSKQDTDVPLPSYTSRATYRCDNDNNILVSLDQSGLTSTGDNTNVKKRLTQRQIYAAQEVLNNMRGVSTQSISITNALSSVKTNQRYYSSGPFAKDVFAIIPLKISGQTQNSPYVDFSGTLQNQERVYFGPVNIHRMTVNLLNDRGETVDLNGANWTFSIICEQLYQQRKT